VIQRDLNVVQTQGALQGVEVEMSIDKAAEHLIMERLIRLYSDTVLACVREISTNAFDATVEASPDHAAVLNGTAGRPIHVTLPTRLAPMFIVRDQGVGMTYDDIVNVYSRYGASTKRESNDYNGALGFGCKAPLAYTPTFSVQTVKDGKRNVVQVGRTPKGGGKMTIVERDAPTTEPNGTTVIVPVDSNDIHRFEDTADNFFLYWTPGTVLVNDEPPETVKTVMRLNDSFAVVKGEKDHIVMAGVAYPVPPGAVNTGLLHGYALVANVPTGAVEFTPSREGLEMTAYTRTSLTQIQIDFRAACKGAIQRKVSEAKTRGEAIASMVHWRAALPKAARPENDTYIWNRQVLPAEWTETRQTGQEWPFVKAAINHYIESRHDTVQTIQAESFLHDIFVTGFGSVKFTSNHKRRLEMWRKDVIAKGTDFGRPLAYILIREDTIPRNVRIWIDPARIVKWADIKANYKLPTTRGQAGGAYSRKRLMGSYDDVWTEDVADKQVPYKWVGETMASDIRQSEPIYYFTTQDYYGTQMVSFVPLVAKRFTVVKLPMNRVEKFKRDFPAALPVRQAAEAAYAAWLPTITQDVKDALAFQHEQRYTNTRLLLRGLDPTKVHDPAVKQGIRLNKIDLTVILERDRLFSRILGKGSSLSGGKAINTAVHDHVYLYMNAVYAAKTTP
jgi:hypothetical protein